MNQYKTLPANKYTLRISVTSLCNLNCLYCNPNRFVDSREDMSDEDILEIIQSAVVSGVRKISWTGGEPTVRRNFIDLVKKSKVLGIENQSMTSNGILYYRVADQLKEAGINKVNFSLDTLSSDEYKILCRFNGLEIVKKSINKALEIYPQVKVNCVVMKDNLGIIDKFVEFGETFNGRLIVRFLEVVPCGEIYENDKNLFTNTFVPMSQMKSQLEKYGKLCPVEIKGDVPKSMYYKINGMKGIYGINPNHSVNYKCDEAACPKIRVNPKGYISNCTIQLKYVRDFRKKSLGERILLMNEIVTEKENRDYTGFRHKQKYYDFWRFGTMSDSIKKDLNS